MAQKKGTRLNKIAREFNIGVSTIVDFLNKQGYNVDSNPNTKVPDEAYAEAQKEFGPDINIKKESEKINFNNLRKNKETVSVEETEEEHTAQKDTQDEKSTTQKHVETEEKQTEEAEDTEGNEEDTLNLKVVGKIDLESQQKEETKTSEEESTKEAVPGQEAPKEAEQSEEAESQETTEEDKEEKTGPSKTEEAPTASQDETTEQLTEEQPSEEDQQPTEQQDAEQEPKVVGKIDLNAINQKTRPDKKSAKQKQKSSQKSDKSQTTKKSDTKEEKTTQPAADLTDETTGTKEEQETSTKEPQKEEETKGQEQQPTSSTNTEQTQEQPDHIQTNYQELSGPKVLGKVEIQDKKTTKDSKKGDKEEEDQAKKKRKRIRKEKKRVDVQDESKSQQEKPQKEKPAPPKKKKKKKKQPPSRPEVDEQEVQQQIKDTLSKLTTKGKSKGAKYRKEKREAIQQKQEEELQQQAEEQNIIKVTEFVSVNELANIMNVDVNEVISTCMNLGLFVSINQRLDAETITLVAEEFNYQVEFTTVDVQEAVEEEEDDESEMEKRPPVITVMGHVDHGKTKLLDYVRQTNIIAGESGNITQHIGAYHMTIENGREITFLDTPGHEAFTAMRARGAKVTDLSIIVIAADDGIKPQTEEAINHASAAGIPMVFAINKIDKPDANPEKVKEQLANMNYLVEEWGGKYQAQEISAIKGDYINDLLEKVLLETDILDLKANPNKKASGTVIETSLDKGKGYVATVLTENGTLHVGDPIVAGANCGRIRAILNERNQRINQISPSHPGVILGLDGAPQAGDKFNVMESEKEAREIANKRKQLQREQGIKAQKHITLEEIGRRIAIGSFQELDVIVKGDVDGSVEALADSLIKLSTEEIQVNIIHKGVGQINENDINLATASDAIIVGFKVRPSAEARKYAEKEKIDMRIYNVIYDAVEEVKSAMEGMLKPEVKEEVIGNLEILETFKVGKVGKVAGCIVRDGKVTRDSKIRLIRDGIVIFNGELGSLKRFKNDVKEATSGYECGLNIKNFNDIQKGDMIEVYKEVEVERKL